MATKKERAKAADFLRDQVNPAQGIGEQAEAIAVPVGTAEALIEHIDAGTYTTIGDNGVVTKV